MIDFDLNQEQQMLREVVARFVSDNHGIKAHRHNAASAPGFNLDHWKRFAELGWLGLCFGDDVGGAGLSFLETAIVMEELGRGLVQTPFLSTAVLCADLVHRADQQQKRGSLLRDLVAGKLLMALAHAEQDSRFDLSDITRTSAVRRGDSYLLNGVKTMALGGPWAHKLIVSACVANDSKGRFALFLVDAQAPGVTMNHYPLIDYSRASDVRLVDVAVTDDALLIGVEHASSALEEAIDMATLACVAEALGCMETVLQLTSEHLKTRVQFGHPLGKFQALQHRMAEMFVEVGESRSILFQALASLDQDQTTRRTAISAAKAYAGQAGKFIGEEGVQLHGGIGVTEEAQIGHYFKKLVLFATLFGDCDYHVDRFARGRGY